MRVIWEWAGQVTSELVETTEHWKEGRKRQRIKEGTTDTDDGVGVWRELTELEKAI